MNNESSKIYTDKESFEKIFSGIFSKFQSFLKTPDSAIQVKFIGYSDENASFIIKGNGVSNNSVIFSRDDSFTSVYAFLQLKDKKDNDQYTFVPQKIRVDFAPRKEQRKILDSKNQLNERLIVVNMMSEYTIQSSLNSFNQKLITIENNIKLKLNKYFQHVIIYFIHHGIDNRMKYFIKNIHPIYITNIKNELPNKNKEIYTNFIENILPDDDFFKANPEIISEISVPIVYNMKIPYGYIRVNNKEPFSESSFDVIKKMALITNNLLVQNDIFQKAEEKLVVFDISKNGIGIIFKNKQCVKYFSEGQFVYFDVLLPDNKKINMLTVVRHISIQGSIYKVGCSISELDALSEVYYEEYLNSLGIIT